MSCTSTSTASAAETFLGTALRRQSVLYIADMFDYQPVEQQASAVELRFKLDAQAPAAVTLPAKTRITNRPSTLEGLIVFELDTVLTLAVATEGEEPEEVVAYATEGITVTDRHLGRAPGVSNDIFPIPDKGVVGGSVQIVTFEAGKQIQWTRVDRLATAGSTQSAFTTWTDEEGTTIVSFGDNAAGRIPPSGSDIYVSYRYGVGARANDIPAGGLTELVVPGDIDVWGVTVTNPHPPQGGTQPESIDSMRYSIPRAAARIKERAVTLADYADLALQVPGVAKAVAHGQTYGLVNVKIAPVGGAGDPVDAYLDRLKNEVEQYLNPRILIGSEVDMEPEKLEDLWKNIYIRVMVHVETGFNRTSVRTTVESALRAQLAFDEMTFGSPVTLGALYRTILAIRGVNWAEINWLSYDAPSPADEIGLDDPESPVVNKIDNLVPLPDTDDELLIPRIEPTEVVVADTFTNPDGSGKPMEVAERTHDGLWVKAVGGLVGS